MCTDLYLYTNVGIEELELIIWIKFQHNDHHICSIIGTSLFGFLSSFYKVHT